MSAQLWCTNCGTAVSAPHHCPQVVHGEATAKRYYAAAVAHVTEDGRPRESVVQHRDGRRAVPRRPE